MAFREARIKSGKSVAEVTAEIGVSDVAVYNWETGVNKPRASLLPKLAAFYGCTIDDLLADSKDDSG